MELWMLIPYFVILFVVCMFILYKVKRHQNQGNLRVAWLWTAVGFIVTAAHWVWPAIFINPS